MFRVETMESLAVNLMIHHQALMLWMVYQCTLHSVQMAANMEAGKKSTENKSQKWDVFLKKSEAL